MTVMQYQTHVRHRLGHSQGRSQNTEGTVQQHWLTQHTLITSFQRWTRACNSHASRFCSAPPCMLAVSCLAGSSSCTASAHEKEANMTSHLQCLLAPRQSGPLTTHTNSPCHTDVLCWLETCAALSSSVCASDHALLAGRSCPNKAAHPPPATGPRTPRPRTAAWQRFCLTCAAHLPQQHVLIMSFPAAWQRLCWAPVYQRTCYSTLGERLSLSWAQCPLI